VTEVFNQKLKLMCCAAAVNDAEI